MSYKCEYCDHYFSTRNAYSQHVNRCINYIESSTEESINDILDMTSSTNEMSLDSIEEFQNIQEENLSPLSESFYHYENYESDSNYVGDISFDGIT
ncbi:4384_t:CDS:2 [Dentiscutata erythropus]|uniref:4384_t:CDS:1 n=1 Tax=Dentiscutata erythropus TaxID=1348616 RepID=A0A9N9BPN0_9GLOM|nr:4384_t:CDS:2 [Dentiscutata erythropus]